MSRATFEMNLKDAAIRLLPKLNEFIESRKTTESFAVTVLLQCLFDRFGSVFP